MQVLQSFIQKQFYPDFFPEFLNLYIKLQYLYYNILEIFIIIKPVIERYARLQIYIYRKNNVSIINLNISMLCSLKENNLFNTI